MQKENFDIVLIGGSAGSMTVIAAVLNKLPANFPAPVVIVLHRQRNVASDMVSVLQGYTNNLVVREPEDKEPVQPRHVYLAPQNYHLLVEKSKTFSFDYSEALHYSRPSIDVTFESTSRIYADKTVGILLSGANSDGAKGIESIVGNHGIAIVQDPATAEFPAMPQAAIQKCNEAIVLAPEAITKYLLTN